MSNIQKCIATLVHPVSCAVKDLEQRSSNTLARIEDATQPNAWKINGSATEHSFEKDSLVFAWRAY